MEEPPRLAREQAPTLQKLSVLLGHLKISAVEPLTTAGPFPPEGQTDGCGFHRNPR